MTAPIGSIIAYAAPVDNTWETANGWMLCNGRLLDRADPQYTALFDAIGHLWGGDLRDLFHVPDLRGYFLRGVEGPRGPGRDPDSDTRGESNKNGQTGNGVGSVQGWGTALPQGNHAFILSEEGRHRHSLDLELDATRDVDSVNNTVAYPGSENPMGFAGLHVHTIQGGHRETRPVNAYVNWIIRFR